MTELDDQTKERIRAEEEFRQTLRAEEKKKADSEKIGCGTILLWTVLGTIILFVGGCFLSLGTPPKPDVYDFGSFGQACTHRVEDQLLSPSSASFSNYYSDEGTGGRQTASGDYIWSGTVEVKNAFGVEVRHNFICTGKEGSETAVLIR